MRRNHGFIPTGVGMRGNAGRFYRMAGSVLILFLLLSFFCVQKYPDMGRTASPVYAGSIQKVSDVVPDQSMKSENAVIGRMVSRSVWSGESRLPDLLWHMRNSFQTDNRMSHRLRIVNNEGQMLLFFLLFVLFLWRRLAFHRSSKYINPELLPFYCSRFLLDLSVRLRKDGKKWAAACRG